MTGPRAVLQKQMEYIERNKCVTVLAVTSLYVLSSSLLHLLIFITGLFSPFFCSLSRIFLISSWLLFYFLYSVSFLLLLLHLLDFFYYSVVVFLLIVYHNKLGVSSTLASTRDQHPNVLSQGGLLSK